MKKKRKKRKKNTAADADALAKKSSLFRGQIMSIRMWSIIIFIKSNLFVLIIFWLVSSSSSSLLEQTNKLFVFVFCWCYKKNDHTKKKIWPLWLLLSSFSMAFNVTNKKKKIQIASCLDNAAAVVIGNDGDVINLIWFDIGCKWKTKKQQKSDCPRWKKKIFFFFSLLLPSNQSKSILY